MKIVVTARNGTREFACEPREKILHAALRSGVELPYECATGTCGTCKARLTSGRAESHWPEAPGRKYFKSDADLLTCQSVAGEDCALEVGPLAYPGDFEFPRTPISKFIGSHHHRRQARHGRKTEPAGFRFESGRPGGPENDAKG